jgi:hypothetical protein
VFVEPHQPIEHGARLLRRRGVVEIYERASVHAFGEDREIAARQRRIEDPAARQQVGGKAGGGSRPR